MVELILAGISLGSIYSLAGLGFVLVFNATRAVNFAHGDLVVLGSGAAHHYRVAPGAGRPEARR